MKRKFFILAMLLISAVLAFGQALSEQAAILKQCLDTPAIQQQFPTDSQGHPNAVYIMQHAVSFPTDIPVSKFGQRIIFLEKDDMFNKNVEAFIMFEKLEISGSNADVIMIFNKNQGNGYQAYEIKLSLAKNASSWSVSETKANWR
ncbi:MAG: hypothetical protein IH597_15925 [Bacteroidales bacterium]|nr:hypothetical protein [Bacteroidales bacterium]